VIATDLRREVLDALEAEHGVRTSTDNRAAVGEADVVLLAVKPQVLPAVLPDVAGGLRPGTLVISLAAGVQLATIEAGLPDGTPVVRVMSNTPVQVDRAMSVVAAGGHARTSTSPPPSSCCSRWVTCSGSTSTTSTRSRRSPDPVRPTCSCWPRR
jgi:pyrroline-5-carboxylate reductase